MVCIIAGQITYGQSKDPIAAELRAFYSYYIVEQAGPIKPFSEDTLKRYCCKAFLHKEKVAKDLDADPVLLVQDYDSDWVRTMQIQKTGTGAAPKYQLCFRDNYKHERICMTIYLKKEEGHWKICKTCRDGYCF